jgi:hypothetical protein
MEEYTDDQLAILGALEEYGVLDQSDLTGAALIPLDRVKDAVQALQARGLVSAVGTSEGLPRFAINEEELAETAAI